VLHSRVLTVIAIYVAEFETRSLKYVASYPYCAGKKNHIFFGEDKLFFYVYRFIVRTL